MLSFLFKAGGYAIAAISLLAASPSRAQTFTNPVLNGADPSVIVVGQTFYSVGSNCADPEHRSPNGNICIRSSPTLIGLRSSTPKVVWRAPSSGSNSADIWAPQLEYLEGRWYIYYAGDTAIKAGKRIIGDNHHKLFALVPDKPGDVLGDWRPAKTDGAAGELPINWVSHWAIDPDVFIATDNRLYLTYSCRPTDDTSKSNYQFQGICISAMSDPLHLTGQVVALTAPTQPWETRNFPTEEGPFGFSRNGVNYILYSGSFSGSPDSYTEGVLINTLPPQPNGKGNALLNPASWVKKGPIFDGHHSAYGTGSVVLVESEDHTELWNVYHGTECFKSCPPGTIGTWSSRNIRMQKAFWSDAGDLVLGYPVDVVTREGLGSAVPLEVPSSNGQGSSALPSWGSAFGDAAEGDDVNGLKVGDWLPVPQASPSTSIKSASLDAGHYDQIFFGANPDLQNYVLSTDLQLIRTGTGDRAPKYGVYGAYVDHNNYYIAMLDVTVCRAPGCVATNAVVNGVDQGWENCPLPGGFNPRAVNHLTIEAVSGTFDLSLNGLPLSGPCQQRSAFLDHGQNPSHGSNGQVGAVVEDTEAAYTNFNVSYGVPQDSQLASAGYDSRYHQNFQQTYAFRNQASRMNLDNACDGCKGTPTRDGVEVVQYPPAAPYPLTTSETQLWTLHRTGPGSFTIESRLSGLCLEDSNSRAPLQQIEAAKLRQAACDGNDTQNWYFLPKGNSYFEIRNRASSLVLDSLDAGPGAMVRLNRSNGESSQYWLLVIQ